MSASAISFVFRTYTPLAFRPETERRVAFGLSFIATIVWFLVIPLEFALG